MAQQTDNEVSYQMSEVTEIGLDVLALTSISRNFGRTETVLTVTTRYFQYDSLLVGAAKRTCLQALLVFLALPNVQTLSRNRLAWGGHSAQPAAAPGWLGQRLEEAVSCFAGAQCHLTIGGKKKLQDLSVAKLFCT